MTAKEIIDIYISFFEKRGHKRIANSPLVPENDPTTLFTSSGMQPLVSYLLGEQHPAGKRLVDVQNCFRAVDIEEVGDNRHETFFRMLGNWSLGDYFKKEEIPWLFELLTKEFGLPKEKLYITVFKGDANVEHDSESEQIWKDILTKSFGSSQDHRIFKDATNWWSRSGPPDKMPVGEPGGPDTEVYFRFDDIEHGADCKNDDPTTCRCGKFLEIANSVFMQYQKKSDGSLKLLPNPNVDYGGGVERLMAAIENKSDIFQTSLFWPIIKALETTSGKSYTEYQKEMQIIADHLAASLFIIANGVKPSNKEQGYVLRRLLRRALGYLTTLGAKNIEGIIEKIVEQYSQTDEILKEKFEEIKLTILEEKQISNKAIETARPFLDINVISSVKVGPDGPDIKIISAETAFKSMASLGTGPVQFESLGYQIDDMQKYAELMKKHQELSRTASSGMFKGGLADTSEQTIMGHTATHLLHQALRDVLGNQLHQTGSNITSERVRFDFNFDRNLSEEELKQVEDLVNEKIAENLPVRFEIMSLEKAKQIGAIGLFDDKYAKDVKVYFVGNYSKEFCGGPHVDFTGKINRFKILKQENIGRGQRRIYSVVNK